jgi:hypothetical protein
MTFLQKKNITIQFKSIIKNLHQSSAGIGNKLKIHKFMLIIAHIINIREIAAFSFTRSIKRFPKAIGQPRLCTASSLSNFIGEVAFFTRFHSSSMVKIL